MIVETCDPLARSTYFPLGTPVSPAIRKQREVRETSGSPTIRELRNSMSSYFPASSFFLFAGFGFRLKAFRGNSHSQDGAKYADDSHDDVVTLVGHQESTDADTQK